MTIEEYSTLMGYEETCEMAEYETADFIYMMAGNMDKQTFCRNYKKSGECTELILVLADTAKNKDITLRKHLAKERQIAHAILREADTVRSTGLEESAEQLDRMAANLIGRKDCITWKLHKGFALSEDDNEYIKDNLK